MIEIRLQVQPKLRRITEIGSQTLGDEFIYPSPPGNQIGDFCFGYPGHVRKFLDTDVSPDKQLPQIGAGMESGYWRVALHRRLSLLHQFIDDRLQ